MKKLIIPSKLNIDACTNCQLRCSLCHRAAGENPPALGYGYLKFQDFKSILDNNPAIKKVFFANKGEMFLNPELITLLEYAYKKKIPVYCDSGVNLNDASDKALEAVVKYKLRSLLCSIDGASLQTYAIYRIGGDFNRVIEHVKRINRYKRLYRSKFPRLIWSFVVFGHNEHELPLARKMAGELGMLFIPKMSWGINYSPVHNKKRVLEETGWPALTRKEYSEVTGSNYVKYACYDLWLSPRINWNGAVLGCCVNTYGEFGGNAFRDGYISSINHEKIDFARNMLLGKVGPRDDIPCLKCELYLEMREKGRYLKSYEILRERIYLYRLARALLRRYFKKISSWRKRGAV